MQTKLLINRELVAGGGEALIHDPKREAMSISVAPGTGIAAMPDASNQIRHAMFAR